MNTSKDQSIIIQVAAKIAADLTPKQADVNMNIHDFLVAFEMTREALFSAHGMGTPMPLTEEQAEQVFVQTFGATPVAPTPAPQWAVEAAQASGGFTIRVKGKQHGPLPEWLSAAAQAKGVSEVWDNRDGLSVNPKRPWFKAVQGDAAFWPPRGK